MRATNLTVAVTIVACAATTLAPGDALAQRAKRAAKAHHDRGVTSYNAGRFEAAIAEFQKAYDLQPHPTLLYNLAQAHRHLGDDEKAIFFYKRYIQTAAAGDRDVEDARSKVAELEEKRDRRAAAAPVTPPPAAAGSEPSKQPAAAPEARISLAESAPQSVETEVVPAPSPTAPWRLTAEAGAGVPFVQGAADIGGQAMLFAGRVAVERAVGAARAFRVGLGGTLSPLAYDTLLAGPRKTSWLLGAFATGNYEHRLGGSTAATVGLGLGVVSWSGLKEGHPFSPSGDAPSGAVLMPSARLAAGLTWRASDNVRVGVAPAYTFSKTTGDVLTNDISGLHRVEANVTVALDY